MKTLLLVVAILTMAALSGVPWEVVVGDSAAAAAINNSVNFTATSN